MKQSISLASQQLTANAMINKIMNINSNNYQCFFKFYCTCFHSMPQVISYCFSLNKKGYGCAITFTTLENSLNMLRKSTFCVLFAIASFSLADITTFIPPEDDTLSCDFKHGFCHYEPNIIGDDQIIEIVSTQCGPNMVACHQSASASKTVKRDPNQEFYLDCSLSSTTYRSVKDYCFTLDYKYEMEQRTPNEVMVTMGTMYQLFHDEVEYEESDIWKTGKVTIPGQLSSLESVQVTFTRMDPTEKVFIKNFNATLGACPR